MGGLKVGSHRLPYGRGGGRGRRGAREPGSRWNSSRKGRGEVKRNPSVDRGETDAGAEERKGRSWSKKSRRAKGANNGVENGPTILGEGKRPTGTLRLHQRVRQAIAGEKPGGV